MSKALCAVTNPPSHQSLDAGWIYTSNLQVKAQGCLLNPLISPCPLAAVPRCVSVLNQSCLVYLQRRSFTSGVGRLFWVLAISYRKKGSGFGMSKKSKRRVGQKQTLWLTRHRRSQREPASPPGPAPEPRGATGLRCPKGNGSALPCGAIWKPPWYCIGEESKRIISGIRLFRLEL